MDMTDKIRIANLERALDKTTIFLEWCANDPCDKGLAEKAKMVLDRVNEVLEKRKVRTKMEIKTIEDKEDGSVDFVVDGKFAIHLKRCDEGYSIDCYDNGGNIIIGSEVAIWDEDLEAVFDNFESV